MNGIKTYLAAGLGLLSSIGVVGTTAQPMIGVVTGLIALAIIFLRMALADHKLTQVEIQADLSEAKDALAEIRAAVNAKAPPTGPATIPFPAPQS